MQPGYGLLIEFPAGDILDVTTNKEWQDKNDGRLKVIESALSILPEPDHSNTKWTSSVKSWLPIGVPTVALLTVIITVGIHLDNKIGAAQKSIEGTNTRLQKVEDAVKVLGSQQSDPTQKLIHDLLAAAQNTSDTTFAARAVQAAASLTATLKQQHRPASPKFFQDSVEILNAATATYKPQNPKELLKARIALAEYRSALELPLPSATTTLDVHLIKPGEAAALIDRPNIRFTSIDFLLEGDSTSAFQIGPKRKGKLSEQVYFENAAIKGGTQTLDGIHWRNVVFVKTRIHYN